MNLFYAPLPSKAYSYLKSKKMIALSFFFFCPAQLSNGMVLAYQEIKIKPTLSFMMAMIKKISHKIF